MFLVSIPHPKGENIVWTCVKDNITQYKKDFKAIGLSGFGYKLFEEEEYGGIQEELDGYPYLVHLINFWKVYWCNQVENMNQAVGEKNRLDKLG